MQQSRRWEFAEMEFSENVWHPAKLLRFVDFCAFENMCRMLRAGVEMKTMLPLRAQMEARRWMIRRVERGGSMVNNPNWEFAKRMMMSFSAMGKLHTISLVHS
jgi:hypothetical protein